MRLRSGGTTRLATPIGTSIKERCIRRPWEATLRVLLPDGESSVSEHYPRIRIHAEDGRLLLREGLSLCFYMRHPYQELASAVLRSLDTYVQAVGRQALNWYSDEEGMWQKLDDTAWARTRRDLLEGKELSAHLTDLSSRERKYDFEYRGKSDNTFFPRHRETAVSGLSFWLPTEYLEEHGPEKVRKLALELAAPLPICSGLGGLSFNARADLSDLLRESRKHCFRYPGLDILDLGLTSLHLGTKMRGPAWLNFLGQPLLGELGGAAGLRSRLRSPETTVEELDGDRVVVTLGSWPEAGDTEKALVLPAYRELARVLEPWLFHRPPRQSSSFPTEDWRRWERRFLD